MQYASVNQVRNLLKRWASKQEDGFISPEDFNVYAQEVQQTLFQSIYQEFRLFQANSQKYLNYYRGSYNSEQAILDDLKHLMKIDVALSASSGLCTLPDDYSYMIGIFYNGKKVEPAGAKRDLIENSNDAAPSTRYPIYYDKGTQIQVKPTTISSGLTIDYFKVPQGVTTAGVKTTSQPTWAYETVLGKPVYNATNSVDFEFPKHLESRLAVEMAISAGIELKDEFLVAVLGKERQKEEEDAKL